MNVHDLRRHIEILLPKRFSTLGGKEIVSCETITVFDIDPKGYELSEGPLKATDMTRIDPFPFYMTGLSMPMDKMEDYLCNDALKFMRHKVNAECLSRMAWRDIPTFSTKIFSGDMILPKHGVLEFRIFLQ